MKKTLLVLGVFCATALATVTAQARGSSSGVMATANVFMYNSAADVTPGGTSDSKSSIYDIKIGYLGGSGLYLGGIYTMRSSSDGVTTTDGKALGASVGYVGATGFFIKGHYLLSAEAGDYKEGTGIQADFGYFTNVTGSFIVGVELTYRSIEYKKNDAIPALEKYKSTELFPMLSVGFVF
ncbi:MAG: hypothetical protein HUU57_07895 [Bdellovibrio sp.]|nr:hypothetical protein [Bdellovibrio sp.]